MMMISHQYYLLRQSNSGSHVPHDVVNRIGQLRFSRFGQQQDSCCCLQICGLAQDFALRKLSLHAHTVLTKTVEVKVSRMLGAAGGCLRGTEQPMP